MLLMKVLQSMLRYCIILFKSHCLNYYVLETHYNMIDIFLVKNC